MTGLNPMPNADPSEELGRLALAEIREVRKLIVGNGSVGLFEQVRKNEDEAKRLWKAFEKLSKAVDKIRVRNEKAATRDLEFLGVRLKVIGQIVIAILAVAGVALDVFF
jgi:hypothetical protein